MQRLGTFVYSYEDHRFFRLFVVEPDEETFLNIGEGSNWFRLGQLGTLSKLSVIHSTNEHCVSVDPHLFILKIRCHPDTHLSWYIETSTVCYRTRYSPDGYKERNSIRVSHWKD